MEMAKNTKNGWVNLYQTEYDENGNSYYVVEAGSDMMPAHYRREFASKKDALAHYKEIS